MVHTSRHDGDTRPAMTILAASATKISAVRNPMPLVAPVMTATLPSSRPMSFSPFEIRFQCISGLSEQRKPSFAFDDRDRHLSDFLQPRPYSGFWSVM